MRYNKGSAERDTRVVLKDPPERTGPSLPSIAALSLLYLLALPACATTRSEIAVEAVVGQGEPQVHVVAKVVIP